MICDVEPFTDVNRFDFVNWLLTIKTLMGGLIWMKNHLSFICYLLFFFWFVMPTLALIKQLVNDEPNFEW